MSSALLSLRQFFDQHEFQAPDLPVVCSVVIPNANALARWRDFPEAALPVRGRVANGTGLSSRDCENSGLGEAVELASACSWKDEQTIQVPIDDAAIVTVHPEEFLGFHLSSWKLVVVGMNQNVASIGAQTLKGIVVRSLV